MTHAAADQTEAARPDPHRVVSARLDPIGAGKLLRLLRTLIAYGRNLVEALRQEDEPDVLPWYSFLTSFFGTTDPSVIAVLITRGLLRAIALLARLSNSVASLFPLPFQRDRAARPLGSGRGLGSRRPRTSAWALPSDWLPGDTVLDREPTPEQEMFARIVAKDHNRPIGPILVDICRDLAIVPALIDPTTWKELHQSIALYGGYPSPLLANQARLADGTGVADAGQKTPDLFPGIPPPAPPLRATPVPLPASPPQRFPHGRQPPNSPLPLREDRAAKRIDGEGGRARKAPIEVCPQKAHGAGTWASPAVLIRCSNQPPSRRTSDDRFPNPVMAGEACSCESRKPAIRLFFPMRA